jgi:hypothetical protein
MTTFPVGLAVALPAISKAASSVVSGVGQSFQTLFADSASASSKGQAGSNDLTIGEQRQEVASEFRTWLSSHGINSPFELEMTSSASGAADSINVRGSQGAEIQQLLQSNSGQLDKLRQLAKSIQSVAASSLGRDTAKITITDLDSNLSY